jgi:hypothetical protein
MSGVGKNNFLFIITARVSRFPDFWEVEPVAKIIKNDSSLYINYMFLDS